MGHCDLIFVMNDGTELVGKKNIDTQLHLFPDGILEKVRPIFFEAKQKAKNWNYSEVRVYQDGRIVPTYDISSESSYNEDFI